MKKTVFGIIACLLAITLCSACTQAEQSSSSITNSESPSFSESVGSSAPASSSVVSSSPPQSNADVPFGTTGALLLEASEIGNTYRVTEVINHFTGYNSVDGGNIKDIYAMRITTPPNVTINIYLSFDLEGQINGIGGIPYFIELQEGQSFSDFFVFDAERYSEIMTQLDVGEYLREDGTVIYYEITELMSDYLLYGNQDRYEYRYLIPLDDKMAACIVFFANEYDRERDEPFFRSIVETVEKYELS